MAGEGLLAPLDAGALRASAAFRCGGADNPINLSGPADMRASSVSRVAVRSFNHLFVIPKCGSFPPDTHPNPSPEHQISKVR